ncbi:MAG: hypothetical protein IJH31_05195 [Erysipelotrichaceae bacterium]|nr:hypothetical protein [Erysipelotrichaceae bacterium]
MKKALVFLILSLMIVLLPCRIYGQDDLVYHPTIYKDELTPVDGVYKISTIKGLENIKDHLDGTFEIVADIDLQGYKWTPIGSKNSPFTGTITANEHIISNFIIEDNNNEDLSFIAYNEGVIDKLFLKDVKIITNENTKNLSIFVANNKGILNRCDGQAIVNLNGLKDGANVGGVVAYNEGELRNNIVKMSFDKAIEFDNKFNFGGIVGYNKNGNVRDCETYGDVIINGSNNKNIGLLAGVVEGGSLKRCAFMGEINDVDKKLYEGAIGKNNGAKLSGLLIRQNGIDDVSEESRKLRNIVVDYMYQMGTILWTTPTDIQTSCVTKCTAQTCHVPLNVGTIYRGLPYKHSSSTLDRMQYCLDENNSLKEWVVELGELGGFQTYFGSACYSSIQLAWARVSNTVNATCAMEALLYGDYTGVKAIGNWFDNWEYKLNDQYTQICIDKLGQDAILEDYALVRAGDAFVKLNPNGAHAIMAASDVVVVRDENGNIDPDHSYLYTHEQGGPNNAPDGISSTWCINRYKTFSTLLGEAYMPLTIEELQTGKMADVQINIEGEEEGILGLTTGIVNSNYFIDAITLDIKENGKDFFNKKVYCRVDNIKDYNGSVAMFDRNYVDQYDLALFSKSIQDLEFSRNKKYHATFTILLQTGEERIIKELDF